MMKRLARACFLLLILGLIPFFLWFLTQDPAAYRFNGLVESESENTGPVETAHILSIDVHPGQHVNAGDVLVRLEPADRAVDLAMHAANLENYEQSALRNAQNTARNRQDLQESARRCRQAVREARVALESEKMNRARDVAALAGLKAEIARLQPLVDKRLVSETELSRLRPAAEALEQSVAQYAPLVESLETQHRQALTDLEAIEAPLAEAEKEERPSDTALTAMRQAADACRQASAKDPSVLRASRSGIVSRVLKQTGDVAMAGEPVIRVASSSALFITGMLTQRQLANLAVGDTLAVTRPGAGRSPGLTAQVEAVDPEVMDLLDPLNPVPRFPLRGRRVRLRVLNENNGLVPGETVTLHAGRRETWVEGVKRICLFKTWPENG
jgi:multidrug resistance efflux pump